ncbi:uncharacterized protein UTRI_06443 [Ustilago trichophora]|uniref:F-box domain-containing protein n=1 Tax=Ustilago trichophora TaxID=86804 RepID=A0A5C3EIT4_9BASI|nr:uncharacterized protein UTRI_06443 [Ustilago trichophora]
MTLSDSLWSFARLGSSWSHSVPPPKPRRRTAIYTQQHIETIGGGSDASILLPPVPQDSTIGNPRLPLELIVHVILLAAQDISLQVASTSTAQLLELARVNRASHRAVLSIFLLPNLRLYGMHHIRAFAISLDKDRLGIRDLARSRVSTLTLRARSLSSFSHGYGPALFDASQAQVHFEKHLVPFIRLVLSHCTSLQTLHIEAVPRGLSRALTSISPQLHEFSCLMGHYGADLDKDFWLPNRWTNLTHLQLHGPRFRITPDTARMLSSLPALKKLALVVPMIVASATQSSSQDLDVNPLQTLIDLHPTLELLLLVGHAERDYVGYTEKYRHWMRNLRYPRLGSSTLCRVELVTALRRSSSMEEEEEEQEEVAASRLRVHPCEVSAWMMGRSQQGIQWFDGEDEGGELDFWVESFQLADSHPSSSSATATTTSVTMSRTASHARQNRLHQQRVADAIEAADMLSSDDEGSGLDVP